MRRSSPTVLLVALFAVLALSLAACGSSKPTGVTTSVTPTSGGGTDKLTAPEVAELMRFSNAVFDYCQHPAKHLPARVQKDVRVFIAVYKAKPEAKSPGPFKRGKTMKQILGDLGGLLNANCDKKLGAEIGGVLAKG